MKQFIRPLHLNDYIVEEDILTLDWVRKGLEDASNEAETKNSTDM